MRNRLKFFPVKNVAHSRAVSKIDMMDIHPSWNGSDVFAFDLRIVKIIEIVEDSDLVPGSE